MIAYDCKIPPGGIRIVELLEIISRNREAIGEKSGARAAAKPLRKWVQLKENVDLKARAAPAPKVCGPRPPFAFFFVAFLARPREPRAFMRGTSQPLLRRVFCCIVTTTFVKMTA